MTPRIYNGTTLGAPTPTHTLTESAEAARQAVRMHAVERKVTALATKHRVETVPEGGWPIPAAAAKLAKMAQALDYEVRIAHGWHTLYAGQAREQKVAAVQVAGIDKRRGLGFRAIWVRGRAESGIWYERGATPRSGEPCTVTAIAERVGR